MGIPVQPVMRRGRVSLSSLSKVVTQGSDMFGHCYGGSCIIQRVVVNACREYACRKYSSIHLGLSRTEVTTVSMVTTRAG